MSENKECCDVSKKCCGGSSAKVFLVLLVVGAIAGLAYMSGKMTGVKMPGKDDVAETAATTETAPEEKKADPSQVIAKVDGVEITRAEVSQLVEVMPQQMRQLPPEQLLPMALEQVINNKIISKKASGADLSNDAEVKKQMELAKEQIIRSTFVDREVAKKIKPEDIKKEYEQYVKNFPKVEEVKASHILVADEAKAKEIIASLDAGKDFAGLAKENSTDGTAQNGGSLGYFSKDDVVPEFSAAAFALEVGKYSKKPVKTEFGFHVLKVEDKRVRPPAEFDQVKPYIEQELRRSSLEALVKDWRGGSKIERFDEKGNLIVQKEEAPAQNAATSDDSAKAPEEAAPAKDSAATTAPEPVKTEEKKAE